jgi:two-component system chemotaxis response regulator CheB
MRQAGAYTVAQDEASSVVFGMPREAILLGAAVDVAAVDKVSELVLNYLRSFGQRGNRV